MDILDDVFNLGNFAKNSLGEMKPNYHGRLEITLNYPRTKPFLRQSKDGQEILYELLFHSIAKEFLPNTIKSHYTFEDCQDGNRHLHGYLDLVNIPNPKGAVMQAVKACLFQMPKATHKQLINYHYADSVNCWKLPAICCQWRDLGERKDHWDTYIEKTQ